MLGLRETALPPPPGATLAGEAGDAAVAASLLVGVWPTRIVFGSLG